MLKNFLFILFLFASAHSFAQTDPLIDSLLQKKIPEKKSIPKPIIKIDSPVKKIAARSVSDSGLSALLPKDSFSVNKTDSANVVQNDSAKIDTSASAHASFKPNEIKHPEWQQDTSFTKIFKINFTKKGTAFFLIEEKRNAESKDALFYSLAGILILLGFIKVSFPKYFMNIFRLFFQTSFRQKQNREVKLQDNLPSLLTNILFFLSAGVFVAIAAIKYNWLNIPFLLLFLYSFSLLAFVYLFKYLVIRLSGFVFRARDASSNYISVIFLVNKLAGIVIIPFTLLYAFSENNISQVIVTVIISILILLLLYRYIMAFSFLRSRCRINPFHFFIYLCIVEIIPMLVIYKVLFSKINGVF